VPYSGVGGWQDYYVGGTIVIGGLTRTITAVHDAEVLTISVAVPVATNVAFTLGTLATNHGMLVGADTSYWKVIGGKFGPSGTWTNSQSFGIAVTAGTSDYYKIIGPDLTGNVTANLYDQGTGVHKQITLEGDTAAQILTASATTALTFSDCDVYEVTGTTPIATLTGGWIGRRVSLIFLDASPGGVTTGGNFARAISAVQYQCLNLVFDGTKWF
jgi:hypothetical protein